MIVGTPKEIKILENRVALVPAGVELLVAAGHRVLMETGAGLGSGFSDEDFRRYGADIVDTPAEIYAAADMIVKVKEPLPEEYPLIRENQIVFTYFHFAASLDLIKGIQNSGCIAIAYETVEPADGSLPLLVPMSEVAGRMSIQVGADCLEHPHGGIGVLLGGVPGVEPASVVILGGGIVGPMRLKSRPVWALMCPFSMSACPGCATWTMSCRHVMPPNVKTIMSNPANIRRAIERADLVIGAVLIHGAKAPNLITRQMLGLMQKRSVIIDVAVDQGGCVETIRPTTHDHPTYEVDGVVHYGVANMPGAVPKTSTVALTNATFRYILEIANTGFPECVKKHRAIAKGVNMVRGKITYEGVADAFSLPCHKLESVI